MDAILGGGLFHGAVYLVTGQPGTGKTIFGNQVCFAHARGGGQSIYCTLLAETHGRMLANLRTLSYFDEHFVGNAITYIEGFATLESAGRVCGCGVMCSTKSNVSCSSSPAMRARAAARCSSRTSPYLRRPRSTTQSACVIPSERSERGICS